MKFELSIYCDGDWHVGEGAGRPGSVDRLVRRHPDDGLPYLPAKTLVGLWRDACERIVAALDGDTPASTGVTRWQDWLDYLFGDQPAARQRSMEQPERPPQAAQLIVRAARFAPDLSAHLQADPTLREAVTLVKPGVRLDADSGQALDRHLRFIEYVRGGAVLKAQCQLDDLQEGLLRNTALALLWAGAHRIERLGGQRRRGAGACRWELSQQHPDKYLKRLRKPPPALPVPPASNNDQEPGQRRFPASAHTETKIDAKLDTGALPGMDSDWVRLPLTIKLLTPAVFPARTTGNVVQSLDYLPGTYLLGPVSRALAALRVPLFPFIARGDLRVLNGYPEVPASGDGAPGRGRPVPLALFYDKRHGGLEQCRPVYNRLLESIPDEVQLKQQRSGFVGPSASGTLPYLLQTPLQYSTHNTVADDTQRPNATVGGVYSYQAVKAGTCLRSELWLTRALAEQLAARDRQWWQGLGGEIRVGLAKKDDYGLASLAYGRPETITTADDDDQPVTEFTLWLLSGLLMRDRLLQPTSRLPDLQQALEQALGCRLSLASHHNGDGGDRIDYALRPQRREGWHRGWGLARPSTIGFDAGGCCRFRVDGRLTRGDLRRLSQAGLGERRAEGMGELVCDAPLLTGALNTAWRPPPPMTTPKADKATPDLAGTALKGADATYLRQLTETAWRRAILLGAQRLATDTQNRQQTFGWSDHSPGNAQLGAWRMALDRLSGTGDRDRLTTWLERSVRAERWGTRAVRQCRALVTDPEAVWSLLANPATETGTTDAVDQAPDDRPDTVLAPWSASGGTASTLRERLWTEALRTVFVAAIHAEVRHREDHL